MKDYTVSNFKFLKPVSPALYEIAYEAEKLYRDEYFEQCMAQTRRLGEQLCRAVLKDKADTLNSFDELISMLKDRGNLSERENEFVEDMYFLKKNGNSSVHSLLVKKDGIAALECLQRAFEASINFAMSLENADPKIEKLLFDEELLALGVKAKKPVVSERYLEEKKKFEEKLEDKPPKKRVRKTKVKQIQEDSAASVLKKIEKKKMNKTDKGGFVQKFFGIVFSNFMTITVISTLMIIIYSVIKAKQNL